MFETKIKIITLSVLGMLLVGATGLFALLYSLDRKPVVINNSVVLGTDQHNTLSIINQSLEFMNTVQLDLLDVQTELNEMDEDKVTKIFQHRLNLDNEQFKALSLLTEDQNLPEILRSTAQQLRSDLFEIEQLSKSLATSQLNEGSADTQRLQESLQAELEVYRIVQREFINQLTTEARNQVDAKDFADPLVRSAYLNLLNIEDLISELTSVEKARFLDSGAIRVKTNKILAGYEELLRLQSTAQTDTYDLFLVNVKEIRNIANRLHNQLKKDKLTRIKFLEHTVRIIDLYNQSASQYNDLVI